MIPINKMTTKHIESSIKMLERKMSVNIFASSHHDAASDFCENIICTTIDWIKSFKSELERGANDASCKKDNVDN